MLKSSFLFFFFITNAVFSQYILTVNELKDWTQSGPTANTNLIATEPLATRFINVATQLNTNLNNNLEIAYLPDGMNNLANYSGEENRFNLYNFTHWAYIDKLVWFGGTASQTVQIPSAPWVNTAHKNGVQVFGNVFFAPTTFGGSTATLLNFLEQDANGNFVAIPRLINMMQYYNFDGWFINQETNTDASTGSLMHQFLGDLTLAVEALNKEVFWYDAMLLNGRVDWQDQLNSNNLPFLQDDTDNNPSNGFDKRMSSNIFINFFWPNASYPRNSNAIANSVSRSAYDVFTGVDLWPGRSQSNFETGGNTWMSDIHQNATTPNTSLGLFVPDIVFRNSQYSNFQSDENDYKNFYSQERHMFAGANRNPRLEDNTGFKGYSNWVPAASTINTIPFETNFNTGHGFKKFNEGVEISNSKWHSMNSQDILPTWQFAFSDTSMSASWDFDKAYNGGSSLKIEGELAAGTSKDLKLYKTQLPITEQSKIDVIYNYELLQNSELILQLTFADAPTTPIEINLSMTTSTNWTKKIVSLGAYAGRELSIIGFKFSNTNSATTITDYALRLGNLRVYNNCNLEKITQNNGWSYYAPGGYTGTGYLFAIEHKPTGNGANTADFEPEITLRSACENGLSVFQNTYASEGEGFFGAADYWNIEITDGSLNGWVNIRWFLYGLEQDLTSVSQTFQNNTNASFLSSELHLKTATTLNLPDDLLYDGLGLNQTFVPMLLRSQGTYLGNSFVQYNQISDIHNSGGSIFRKVTNRINNGSGTTPSNAAGTIRFNPNNQKFEGFNGTEWKSFN